MGLCLMSQCEPETLGCFIVLGHTSCFPSRAPHGADSPPELKLCGPLEVTGVQSLLLLLLGVVSL